MSSQFEPGEHVVKGINRLRQRFFSAATDTASGIITDSQISACRVVLGSIELFNDGLSGGVGVPEQHPGVAVPTDKRHFRYTQALFEESTNCFVSEIVEMKVFDTRSYPQSIPCQPKRIRRNWEQAIIGDRNRV